MIRSQQGVDTAPTRRGVNKWEPIFTHLRAHPEDPLSVAARAGYVKDIRLLDFTDYFCDPAKCYTVVGGVNVYYDANHLNRVYSELLAPMLLDRLPK